jgi:hypothetical protein
MRDAVVTSMMAVGSTAPSGVLANWARTSKEVSRDESRDGSYRFFRVLFDNTSAEGAAFGAKATARGAAARGVGIDLGSLWMHEIEPQWKNQPAAIAGLTSGPHLFCLELLARDYAMGLVYRVRHAISASDQCSHIISGPVVLSAWTDQLGAAGRDWARRAAALAMDCPGTLRASRDLDLVDLASCSALGERSLFSWVIAPVDGTPALRGPEADSLRSRPRDSIET